MAFELTTFRTLVGCSNHRATRTQAVSDGQLWADTTTASRSHIVPMNTQLTASRSHVEYSQSK